MLDRPLVEAFKYGMLRHLAMARERGTRVEEEPQREEWYRAMAELICEGLACDQEDPMDGAVLFYATRRGIEFDAQREKV